MNDLSRRSFRSFAAALSCNALSGGKYKLTFVLTPQIQICRMPVVVIKLGSLHSASIWPPFRLCARSVALKWPPPPSQTFSQLA
jgi:hypothetical protein